MFRKTAAYGHFGRSDAEFTWERTDRAEALREAAAGAASKPARAAKRSGKNGSARSNGASADAG